VTWNPADKNAAIVLSNSNVTAGRASGNTYAGVRGTTGYTSGTYYFEATVPGGPGAEGSVGLANAASSQSDPLGYGSSNGVGFYPDGNLYTASGSASPGGNYYGVRLGFLVNVTSRRLWIKNASGAWIVGGDPASSAGFDISGISGALYPMATIYFVEDTSTIYSEAGSITLGLPSSATLWGDASGTSVTPPTTSTRKATRLGRWL
jgi:hypothetical protein